MQTSSTSKSLRSDEGLTLETSAFQIFHGGNFTFINSFDKTKFLFRSLPPTQHHSFFRNWKFIYQLLCHTYEKLYRQVYSI